MLKRLIAVFLALGLSPALAEIPIQKVPLIANKEAWMISSNTVPMIAFQMSFPRGSTFDPKGKEGLARFASSTMDEGAGEYDSTAFQKALEMDQITLNFSATADRFTANLVCLKTVCPKAFDLLKLALIEPRFDKEPVERMRASLLTNLEAEKTDPDSMAERKFLQLAYPNHPYDTPSDGTEQSVKTLTEKDLKDFVTHLTQKGIVISASGDVNADELKTFVNPILQKLPESSDSPVIPVAVIKKEAHQEVLPLPVPQTTILFGSEGLSRKDPDFIPAYVMNHILGAGGFSSRLTKVIREDHGLTYGVGSYLNYGDYGNVWMGQMATKNDQTGKALKLLKAEMKKIVDTPVSATELEDAKQYLLGSYILRLDSNTKLANWLDSLQTSELSTNYLDERQELIKKVTVEDIQRVAKRVLDADKMIVVMVGQPKL